MINVSNEFRKLMNERTDFKEYAEITLVNGTVLELAEKDFAVNNNKISDASKSRGIPLGQCVTRSIKINIMNDDDRFSEYDFFGAKIRLYLTFQLSETVERIEYGEFTVLTPETYGETIIITALDDMYKADVSYSTTLLFPATLQAILVDLCNTIGISLGTTTFLNDDFIVQTMPTGITCRQLIGYISMIAGGNARIDTTGRLRIITYDFESMSNIYDSIISGGRYKPWDNPSEIYGGTFSPWNEGDVVDGGTFGDRKHFHVLNNFVNSPKVDTDDVVITGVQTTYTNENDEEIIALYGVDGYVLKVDNPLIEGKEQEAIDLIGSVMVGGRFRQFSGDLVADPTCEFMDTALVVDRKGNVYISFLTDINFQFFGFTTLKNSAEPALRNSSTAYSEATKTLVSARKFIQKERTAREKAVEQLAKDLQNSSGLFMTEEKQEDGSVIYYMHDKPTLSESMIVWKLTALAFAISNDGGKTYPYGFTVDGTTITRLLYAEGVDADYIDTGAIRITDGNGNTMFLADYDTKEVYINASTVKIGSKAITDEFVEQAASISLNAFNISAEINRASAAEGSLSTRINTNAGSIEAEVRRAQGQEVELAAAISLIDDKVELKASKGELSSLLSVESGAVTIKSNRFSWESTYSSLSSDGKLKASDVDLTGKITANSGKIGGFDIGTSSIYSGKSSLTSDSQGVYIGTDGISIGYGGDYSGPAFKVTSAGDISIRGTGEIKFGTTDFNTLISDTEVKVYYNYIDKDRIRARSPGSSSIYCELTYSGITAYSAYNKQSTLTASGLEFYNTDTFTIKAGSQELIHLYKSHCVYAGDIASLGTTSGKISFFGSSSPSSTQKTVSNITSTSTATASTIATKLNELLTALRAYNLIG